MKALPLLFENPTLQQHTNHMENTNESVLFEHNREAVERIREAFRYGNRAAIVHATGTVKTGK